jgi:hypothetical protein
MTAALDAVARRARTEPINEGAAADVRRTGRPQSVLRPRPDPPVLRRASRTLPSTDCRPDRRIPRAMSDQDRQHSVTNADLRRGARSPNPGAVRLADHMGGQHAAPPGLAVNSA